MIAEKVVPRGARRAGRGATLRSNYEHKVKSLTFSGDSFAVATKQQNKYERNNF